MGHWPGYVKMDVVVKRARAVAGRIAAPPSKSMAHRAVLCAALAKGTSHLHHLAFSKDISATLGAAGRLCARVTTGENDAVVEGLGRFLPVDAPVDCCESGSTLRFLIPLAVVLFILIILHPYAPKVLNNVGFAYLTVACIDTTALATHLPQFFITFIVGSVLFNGVCVLLMKPAKALAVKSVQKENA